MKQRKCNSQAFADRGFGDKNGNGQQAVAFGTGFLIFFTVLLFFLFRRGNGRAGRRRFGVLSSDAGKARAAK
jgi:hypothetical protein